jgi:Protein of unknown function (DUF3788)
LPVPDNLPAGLHLPRKTKIMIDERPFMDKLIIPTEQDLRDALNGMYFNYQKIIEIAKSFSREWMFSKSGGWMLKIFDPKKTFLYLIPFKDGFKINLAIRENERENLLRDETLVEINDQIRLAKKFVEGFALQFEIFNDDRYQIIESFITRLIVFRN